MRYSTEVLRKARLFIEEGRVERDEHSNRYWAVRGTSGRYRVAVGYREDDDGTPHVRWATCTCPHGQNNPEPTCSHIAAVLLTIKAERKPT